MRGAGKGWDARTFYHRVADRHVWYDVRISVTRRCISTFECKGPEGLGQMSEIRGGILVLHLVTEYIRKPVEVRMSLLERGECMWSNAILCPAAAGSY